MKSITIYFNDSTEEIKRYYIDIGENITKIKIILDYQIVSFKNYFIIVVILNLLILKNFIGKILLI